MKHIFGVLGVALVFFAPTFVNAETVVRTGSSVSVDADQIVENDFYAAGESVIISGSVKGDAYLVSGTATINGEILTDLTVLAGTAQVHAPVTDDVRIIAGEVVLAEHVGGDVFVLGGSLKILSSAQVGGNVYFYGGEIEINGPVTGSVMGTAESMRIDSVIDGSIDVVTSSLVLGDRANVAGDVQYKSPQELIRGQDAVVVGDITKSGQTRKNISGIDVRSIIWSLFISLFATLCFYLVFKSELQSFINVTLGNISRSTLLGVGALVVVPIVVLLLLFTVLGILVGFIGLFVYIAILLLAYVLMSTLVAGLYAKLFNKSYSINLGYILLGALTLQLLLLIPVVGPFAFFVLFMTSLGGLVYSAYRAFDE